MPEDESRTLNEAKSTGQAATTSAGTIRFMDKKSGIETKDYYHGYVVINFIKQDIPCFSRLLPAEDMVSLLKENGDFCVRTTEIISGSDRAVSSYIMINNMRYAS